ncbi:hypothetical protein [Nostoc commune]|nr:hypothetical protein [Nostoc commune]
MSQDIAWLLFDIVTEMAIALAHIWVILQIMMQLISILQNL